jgi:hypothetical protein
MLTGQAYSTASQSSFCVVGTLKRRFESRVTIRWDYPTNTAEDLILRVADSPVLRDGDLRAMQRSSIRLQPLQPQQWTVNP